MKPKTIVGVEIPGTLEMLEARVRTLLPEQYQDCYDDVQPVSMGSAGLRYGRDGKVAWDSIWGSFCDLAMAGGPPHKGKLLEPGALEEIAIEADRYADVVDEICRGIRMTTGLMANFSSVSGWVSVDCENETTADWLVRAIAMENVSAFREGAEIHLPAGPAYRIEREVKNVVTAVAKTSHYWFDHTRPSQQREIGDLLSRMAATSPLVQPPLASGVREGDARQTPKSWISEKVERETALRTSTHSYFGWCGFDFADVHTAIWMMRALAASNVLSRREDVTLFVPVNPASDPDGSRVAGLLIAVHGLAMQGAPR